MRLKYIVTCDIALINSSYLHTTQVIASLERELKKILVKTERTSPQVKSCNVCDHRPEKEYKL